jgi:predicted TIM-barrel fold metal-dependent hydrolase
MADVQVTTRPAGAERQPVTLVDCDVHSTITRAMMIERTSPQWRRHFERFGLRSPPITELYPRARNAGMRADSWPGRPGSVPGSDRELLTRQLLDEYDVDFAILNTLGLQDCNEVPGFAAELARVQNDWMQEEWLDRDPRLLAAVVIPFEYPDAAVREIERRAGDRRWVQVLMPSAAHEPLGSARYWPIYEAAAAHGLPVSFHTGGYSTHVGAGWPSYYLEEHVSYALAMQNELLSVVCEGVFQAFPDLRLVLAEGGATWAGSLRWRLDAAWSPLREEVPRLERPPSEYVRDHVWFTTQPMEEPDDPRHLLLAIEHGQLADRLVFATDYPHWDFDSPTQSLPRALPAETRAAILAGNACELYRLPREREVPAR